MALVPSQKRRRQQQRARQARRAELEAQRRARQRQRVLAAVALLVIVGLMAGVFLVSTGDPAPDPAEEESGQALECPPADGSGERRTTFAAPPPQCIDPAKSYTATVETDVGAFTIALDAQGAPRTVNNFVFLARSHYYDGAPFHRVKPGFVVQGGDGAKGDGTGGPGYTTPDELPEPGQYQVGSVAMANTGRPHSGGSQFFVVTGPQGAALPPRYSLFGSVTAGLDVVKRIEQDGSPPGSPEGRPPAVVHRMVRMSVSESEGAGAQPGP